MRTGSKKQQVADMFEAVISGKLSAVKRLVQGGASVNIREKDGVTPIMIAASRGDSVLIRYLIENGANLKLRNEIGQTVVMIASKTGHARVLHDLVLAGAEIDAVDNEGRNAISWAVSNGDHPEVISTLAVLGADYNMRDKRGLTPLMRAALLGYGRSVGVLLAVGADANVKVKGKTAYDMAFARGHEEVCQTIRTILANRPKGFTLRSS